MDYLFSHRVNNLKPSAIREIFKYAADPGVISLSAGNPAPAAFPSEAIAKISERILKTNPALALQYNITEGYAPLRKHLKEYMEQKYNSFKNFDELIITSGAQQVMDLATKTLCNPGDTVVCESPSFIGSINTFRSYGVQLCGVPLRHDGMDMDKLEQALKSRDNVKFIYTIPNFQNPSGITMSLKKRKQMLELAKKYNVLILEDNPYGDIRFTDDDLPNIKSFDEQGIVLYAGTFSKVVSPGMRVGFAIAPSSITQKMIVCKQGQDVHTNIWAQVVIDEFMQGCDFEEHLKNLRSLYSEKAGLMVSLLNRYLMPEITYEDIRGGFFAWCSLPKSVDMQDFCKQALERRVCVVPGNAFLVDEHEDTNCFRLNFSTPTDEQLIQGMEILGQLKKDIMR